MLLDLEERKKNISKQTNLSLQIFSERRSAKAAFFSDDPALAGAVAGHPRVAAPPPAKKKGSDLIFFYSFSIPFLPSSRFRP